MTEKWTRVGKTDYYLKSDRYCWTGGGELVAGAIKAEQQLSRM